jgi:phosphatidylinositol alpha-1,6-mannosyltransferase
MQAQILVIASEFPPGPGGIGQHASSLVHALSSYQPVTVLAHQDYAEPSEIAVFNGQLSNQVTLIPFVRRWGKLQLIYKIITAIKLYKRLLPERVIVTGRFPVWVGGVLKVLFKDSRVYGFAHGSEVTVQGGLLSKITYASLRKLDAVFAVSAFTKEQLKPAKMSFIQVIPNGIDACFLEGSLAPHQPYQWSGEPKLLTVGNVTPRKGQHRVIQALPAIKQRMSNIHYHMVGLPTTQNQLEQLARNRQVSDQITFHGRLAKRTELYRAFVSSDIFIMLSENQPNGDVEGFGIAILEANAFGIPAIGAKGCGIEDAISPESGILVDGNNPAEIADAVQRIMNNYTFYSNGARRWAEQHNWDELVKQVVFM